MVILPRMAILATAVLTACTAPAVSPDAGCAAYGEARTAMPRPLGAGPLAEYIAVTDAAMTAACRP
jgi:hypothetical protein